MNTASPFIQLHRQAVPDSAYIKLCFAMFLLDVRGDYQQLRQLLNEIARDRRPPLDIQLKLYYISMMIPRGMSTLSDLDETELEIANSTRRLVSQH